MDCLITSTKDNIQPTNVGSNLVEVYTSEEFGNVRAVNIYGEPWFVAKDVCDALKHTNPTMALQMLEPDERTKLSLGRGGETNFINESGLYTLIIKSNLPKAKQFRKWVTSDVLPSIRKNGIYATDNVIDEIMNNPEFGIKLLTKLKEEREARIKAEQKNAILTHVNKTYTMTEIAKELNMKSAIELNKHLAEMKIQYKVNGTWVFYSNYSNLGYEDIKQEVLDNGRVVYHRKITQLGREFILGLFDCVA